jgi:hypothetical protein
VDECEDREQEGVASQSSDAGVGSDGPEEVVRAVLSLGATGFIVPFPLGNHRLVPAAGKLRAVGIIEVADSAFGAERSSSLPGLALIAAWAGGNHKTVALIVSGDVGHDFGNAAALKRVGHFVKTVEEHGAPMLREGVGEEIAGELEMWGDSLTLFVEELG